MVTLQKIAELAHVSKSAASYAFSDKPDKRDKLSVETRERILEIARKFNYQPSVSGRGLALSRSYSLGLLLSKKNVHGFSPHFMAMFHGVADAISKSDYNLPLFFGWNEKLEANIRQHRLDGLLVVSRLLNSPVFDKLSNLDIPVLCLNRLSCGGNCLSVTTDMNGWAEQSLKVFAERGYRKAALYSRDPAHLAMDADLAANFPQICAKFGIESRQLSMDNFTSEADDVACLFRGDCQSLKHWFQMAPAAAERTAVFCSPDTCIEEGYPLECCSYHCSSHLGEVGALTLIQEVESHNAPRNLLLPCLKATQYKYRPNTILDDL